MFAQEKLNAMPWNIVDEITFSGRKIKMKFVSGNELHAEAPDQETIDQFYDDAVKRLSTEKIRIES
jgi:hypothetical protein